MQYLLHHKYTLAILLFLILGIGITVFLARQSTDFRQRAAGSFYDTFFPVGAFDAMIPGPNELTAYINDVSASGMDSLMMNNNPITNTLQQQMLDVADQKSLNYIIGPQNELYTQWWSNSSVSEDLATAKQIAQPLVDLMKNHSSLKGYNLVDDADGQSLLKRNLMQQAFYELDPTRQVSYIKGVSLDRYDFVNSIQPRAVYEYGYPASNNLAACDWRRGDQGQRDWIDNFRIGKQFVPDNTPIYQILQTHQTVKNSLGQVIDQNGLRYPTVEELRLQQWLAIGEGATGLLWFTYNDLTDTDPTHYSWQGWKNNPSFKTEIFDLSKRIQPFKSTLAQLKKIDDKFTVSGTGKVYASSLLHKTENRLFVLVANRECTQQTLTLSTKYLTGELKDLETGTTQAITSPITLRGGDGKIYELVNASLISPQPTPAPVTNLLQNPGFESLDATGKPLAWTAGAANVDTTVKHSGNNSIKVVGPVTEVYFWNKPTLKPNTKYMMSAWVKTENATRVGPDYIVENPGIPGAFATIRLGGTKDWSRIFTFFTTPSNFVSGRLDIRFTLPAGGTGWIDDVEVCEVSESCTPLAFTTLQPFTVTTAPSPTPTVTTINSVVTGVTYQTTPWDDTSLTTFMKNLASTMVTRHAKKNITRPEYQGMLYEFQNFTTGKSWQGTTLDTMHDETWVGTALASAYRATLDTSFLSTLNTYPLTFYPNILNNSDKYFPLGLSGQGRVSDLSLIQTPSTCPTCPVAKGITPFWFDDGESSAMDPGDGKPLIGFQDNYLWPSGGSFQYTGVHMEQDIANMLGTTYKLTKRTDLQTAMENLVKGDDAGYALDAAAHPSTLAKFYALKFNPTDTTFQSEYGPLPAPPTTGSFIDPNLPPFDRGGFYSALHLNTPNQQVTAHIDDPVWDYYKAITDQDRKPLDDAFAKRYAYLPYSYVVMNQLWFGTTPRQPGMNKFDIETLPLTEKYCCVSGKTNYYADISAGQPQEQGSRLGPQVMWTAAIGLQLIKQFPTAWDKWRLSCCTGDTQVEIKWTTPTLDATTNNKWYSSPITLDAGVTAQLASTIDTLYVYIDRPVGKAVPFTIYARPQAGVLGGTFTINSDLSVTALGRNGTDVLEFTKATGTASGREQIELAISYTIVKSQKPWVNAVDDSRLSIKGANGTITNLFFYSSQETVKQILEKELLEGLRFWEAIYNTWGTEIPSGWRLADGKNGIWYNFSDLGGYAQIIHAASAYKEYLDGKNDWELYKNVTSTEVTPQPTNTPAPTNTPIPVSMVGDINKDGKVDLLDFNIWRDEFLGTTTTKQSDLNADSKVDLLDFNIWLSAYKANT